MRAVVVRPDSSLVLDEVPSPVPGPGEVRLQVHATAVNRADLLQRRGLYPPPPGKSEILGMEAAGIIVEVGPGVTGWAPGDRVAALLAGGGYAGEVCCPAGHLLPVPADMPLEDAAVLPEVLTTAWLNLVEVGHAHPGDRVLVHAGGSGVGTTAVQLCRHLGLRAWVTAGSDEKIALCRRLGAAGGANRHRERFADYVDAWTDGRRMDVILDPVGGAYLDDNLRSLATGGRLVLIGLLGGRRATVDLGRLLVKRQQILGSTLRSRGDADKTRILDGLRAEVWPAVLRGEIVPVIDRVVPLSRADDAHAVLATNQTVGKIVLRVGEDELTALHEA